MDLVLTIWPRFQKLKCGGVEKKHQGRSPCNASNCSICMHRIVCWGFCFILGYNLCVRRYYFETRFYCRVCSYYFVLHYEIAVRKIRFFCSPFFIWIIWFNLKNKINFLNVFLPLRPQMLKKSEWRTYVCGSGEKRVCRTTPSLLWGLYLLQASLCQRKTPQRKRLGRASFVAPQSGRAKTHPLQITGHPPSRPPPHPLRREIRELQK